MLGKEAFLDTNREQTEIVPKQIKRPRAISVEVNPGANRGKENAKPKKLIDISAKR